jgi:phosphoserine phosphatase RsbU/P
MPMVCRNDSILNPEAAGVPVGLLEKVEYDEKQFQTESGDVVALYSDGIQDQQNPAGEEYTKRRFPGMLRKHAALPAQEIANRIFADLDRFRGPRSIHDDQTLIILKVH